MLAAHLGGAETRAAVAFYCGTFVFGSAAFNLLVEAIARGHLCRPDVDAQAISRIRRGFRITFVVYLAATVIALVAPYVALAINVAVRVHLLRIRYQLAPSDCGFPLGFQIGRRRGSLHVDLPPHEAGDCRSRLG